ncbi:MAG: YfbK domain-containing protein, partial [Paracoccaceae bacterium]
IGAGHSVTAIYEITPVGSAAVLNDPLRYGGEAAVNNTLDELGFLRLRYKNPGEATSHLIETPIAQSDAVANADVQFAVAMSGFGQLLRGSDYLGDWSWGQAIDLAGGALGEDNFGYRREAINLMRLAQSLSN